MRTRNIWLKYGISIIAVLIFVFPILLMVKNSLVSGGISNYYIVITDKNIPQYMLNSVIVTAVTILATFLVAASSAYAFSFYSFRGNRLLYLIFISGLMMAPCSIVVPLFVLVKNLGLLNNYLGLIGPYVSLSFPFSMLIIKGYYDDLPRSFIEAAHIDGCTSLSIFTSIVLPLSRPVMAVSIVMTFLFSWNEFLIAMLVMMKKGMQMITMAPINYMGQYQMHVGKLFSILLLIALPTMIAFFSMQNQFIKGMTSGAIKE